MSGIGVGPTVNAHLSTNTALRPAKAAPPPRNVFVLTTHRHPSPPGVVCSSLQGLHTAGGTSGGTTHYYEELRGIPLVAATHRTSLILGGGHVSTHTLLPHRICGGRTVRGGLMAANRPNHRRLATVEPGWNVVRIGRDRRRPTQSISAGFRPHIGRFVYIPQHRRQRIRRGWG